MTDYYTYQKKREEFGRFPMFEDTETESLAAVRQQPKFKEDYIKRNPDKHVMDNIPKLSEHSFNTELVATQNKIMKHVQGGWPSEYDPTEPDQVIKYKRRLERDQNLGFSSSVQVTVNEAKNCILQNN
jgi:dynein intermediate chain 2